MKGIFVSFKDATMLDEEAGYVDAGDAFLFENAVASYEAHYVLITGLENDFETRIPWHNVNLVTEVK